MSEPLFSQPDSKDPSLSNKDISADKDSPEQKELDRKTQAHKEKISFSFSWIAIIVRGIVGSFISLFVFTQAHRIEDEDSMNRFLLLSGYNSTLIEQHIDNLMTDLVDAGSLYYILPTLSDREFKDFTQQIIDQRPFIKKINWLANDQLNSQQNILQAKQSKKPTLSYTPPEDPTQALAGTVMKLTVPTFNKETEEVIGFVIAEISLSKLVFGSINPDNRYATDIFVYSEKSTANQLLYFFNAETHLDRIPPEQSKDLTLSYFNIKKEIPFGDQKLLFFYNATPAYVIHTWQATIAAGIGIVITTFIVVTAWILLEIEKQQFSNVLHEEHIQEIEGTVDLLETTKNRLVAQENLASLGGLTAGIAHEIKNPLNFINNFSTLSVDLVDDIDKYISRHQNAVPAEETEDILETLDTLKENINTIHEQGQRADSTIQRMLAHSRGKAGEWVLTDMHKLLEEYLAFSYHGMRAKSTNFNVKIEKEFESDVKDIMVVTNDLSRVFLNLLNNAFQAIDEKIKKLGKDHYTPTVTVKTQNVGKFFRVRIRDNGMGIDEENKAMIFTPFFTTKPTGVGTGLGLSLAYNIVVREHGGSLTFESAEGEFTEFIITIPLEPKHKKEEIKQ
jgi:signal transduction histidine kinase